MMKALSHSQFIKSKVVSEIIYIAIKYFNIRLFLTEYRNNRSLTQTTPHICILHLQIYTCTDFIGRHIHFPN